MTPERRSTVDVTKCDSDSCPVKDQCYRSTAPPEEWKRWNDFYIGAKNCVMFIDAKKRGSKSVPPKRKVRRATGLRKGSHLCQYIFKGSGGRCILHLGHAYAHYEEV